MAPTNLPRVPSGENLRYVSRSISSALSNLSKRDVTSTATPLTSIFALVFSSKSHLSRRALTSIADLRTEDAAEAVSAFSTGASNTLAIPLAALHQNSKRQNAILAIPTTYYNLNAGPSPGAVVGIVLGSVVGFILVLFIFLITLQFFGFGLVSDRVVEEEVIVKRRSREKSKSRSRSKSHKSEVVSEHMSEHISVVASPPPPRASRSASRRETIVEIEETFRREPTPPPPEPDEVIVMEEESSHAGFSEEIVEVIEEQSSIMSPEPEPEPEPPSRKPSKNRRSGFRVIDPAEPGGGDAPMRRLSRRSRS